MPPSTSLKLATAAVVTLSTYACAFQPHVPWAVSYCQHRIRPNFHLTPKIGHPTDHPLKPLHAKKSSGSGFGASTKPSGPKTRTVTGYTGSGTKVLADAANNFDRLRKLHGKDATIDLYVRSPLNDETTYWFVGKVIRHVPTAAIVTADHDPDLFGSLYPTPAESILSQKRLILEYAKNQLRPQNFAGKYSSTLEIWMAPGDSEMDVVQNKVTLEKVVGSTKDLREGFSVKDCGYNPEIYVGEEKERGGLRVIRDEEGRPVKPVFEIN
ncbi:hypothetical protein ACHAW6_002445 [Cyclotella cf. meneghiniana]